MARKPRHFFICLLFSAGSLAAQQTQTYVFDHIQTTVSTYCDGSHDIVPGVANATATDNCRGFFDSVTAIITFPLGPLTAKPSTGNFFDLVTPTSVSVAAAATVATGLTADLVAGLAGSYTGVEAGGGPCGSQVHQFTGTTSITDHCTVTSVGIGVVAPGVLGLALQGYGDVTNVGDHYAGVSFTIFYRPSTIAPGPDTISVSNVTPAAGSLTAFSTQQFTATAQYALNSAATGTVTWQLTDQTNKAIAVSPPVNATKGTSTVPLTLTGVTIPASGTLSLTAMLQPSGGTAVSSPATTYTVASATDSVTLTNITPSSGTTLAPQTTQAFSATAQYMLGTAATGILTLELSDQTGKIIANSTSVNVNRGSSTSPLTIPAFTLPLTGSLTLQAVLQPTGGKVVSSTATSYTIVAPSGTVAITQSFPDNTQPLAAGRMPPFVALANYTLQGSAKGDIFLQVVDKNGSVLAYGDTSISVTAPSGTVAQSAPYLRVSPFDLASSFSPGSIFLQAGVADHTSGKTLGMSNKVEFKIGGRPTLSANFGCLDRDGSWAGPRDPATSFLALRYSFLSFRASRSDCSAVGLQLFPMFDGPSAELSYIVTDTTGRLLDHNVAPQSISNNMPTVLLIGLISAEDPLPDQIVIKATLTLPNGQMAFSEPLQFPVEYVTITKAVPENDAILPANDSTKYQLDVKYSVQHSGLSLYRWIVGDSALVPELVQANLDGKLTVHDVFPLVPAQLGRSLYYTLGTSDNPLAEGESLSVHYSYSATANIAPTAGLGGGAPIISAMAGGALETLKDLAKGNTSVKSIKKDAGFNTGFGIADQFVQAASNSGPAKPGKNLADRTRFTSTLTDLLPIHATWTFDPPIPADGSFAANLTLQYTAAELPDDPNLVESNLQIVSFDPATGTLRAYPTIVDTVNRTATATIDSLAPVYTLAMLGPFSNATLNLATAGDTSTTTLYVVTNGTSGTNLGFKLFDSTGAAVSGSPANQAATPGLQIVRSLAQTFNPPAGTTGMVQVQSNSTSVSGTARFQSGRRFETLALSEFTSPALILTDVEASDTFSTTIHLANPTPFNVNYFATLFNPAGGQVGTAQGTLVPKGSLQQDVTGMFGVSAPFSGYVTITADDSISAAEVITSALTMATLGAKPLLVASAQPSQLYSAQLYAGLGNYTTIHLVNPTQNDANLTLVAYNESGTQLGNPVGIAISAGNEWIMDSVAAFGLSPDVLNTGIIAVQSNVTGVVGDVSFGDGLGNTTRSSLVFSSIPSKLSVIPLVENDSAASGSISVANTNWVAASVTVTLYNSAGGKLGTMGVSIKPNGRATGTVAQWFPSAGSLANSYATISSDQPVLAFALLQPATGDFAIVPARQTPAQATAGELPGGLTPASNLSLSTASIDFGATATGTQQVQTLAISNTGNVDLLISSITGIAAPFSFATPVTGPITIAPGATQNLTVRFAPTSSGSPSTSMMIASNDPGRPMTSVSVTGFSSAPASSAPQIAAGGVGNAASGQPVLSRGSLGVIYGTNLVNGAAKAGSLPLGSTLNGTSVSVGGFAAPPFSLTPNALSGLDLVSFVVPFEAPLEGTSAVTITRNGVTSLPVSVAMQENSPGVFLFGADPIATHLDGSLINSDKPASASETIIVYYTGSGGVANPPATGAAATASPLPRTLKVSSATVDGKSARMLYSGLVPGGVGYSEFVITLPSTLNSSTGKSVLEFHIGDAAAQPVNVAVVTSTASAPNPDPAINMPTLVAFGGVAVGQTSTLSVSLANVGGAPLTISSIGSLSAPFTLSALATPFTVSPGGQQTITVSFTPTSAGSIAGKLSITSNDPTQGALNVSVTGTGIASAGTPTINVSPNTLAFGSVNTGQTKDLTVAISNTGNASLTVKSLAVSGAGFLVVSPSAPFSVSPGAATNATVRFAPTAAATATGTVTITSNDPSKPTITIQLGGAGVTGGTKTVILQVDGGTFDSATGFANGQPGAVFMNRLTPPSYPATLQNVQIYFGNRANGLPLNASITVAYGSIPMGSTTFNLSLAPSQVLALGTFNTYTVDPVTITSGDFFVGFQVDNAVGIYPADTDRLTPSQGRSYYGAGGFTLTLLDSVPNLAGNLAIRANVTVPQ